MKDLSNPLLSQENPKPSSEVIAREEEWEVERILAVKFTQNTLKYRVTWIGHNPEPRWYSALDFHGILA
jgi:hypothetical protein